MSRNQFFLTLLSPIILPFCKFLGIKIPIWAASRFHFDPVLFFPLIRRILPNLCAKDICGIQPTTKPTGLIFALKSRYSGQTLFDKEKLFQ